MTDDVQVSPNDRKQTCLRKASTQSRPRPRRLVELFQKLFLELDLALQPLIAVAALEKVDAGRFQRLAGNELTALVALSPALKPLGETIRATQTVGLQLPRDAIAPGGGDLVFSGR